MTISFDSIPVGIRTPDAYLEVNSSRAVQGTPAIPHVALCIGQRLAAGSIAAEIPTLVPSPEDADTYFGRGSILANMCRAFKAVNVEIELWAIALDDNAGGTAATGTIVLSGTATEAGTLSVYVEGRLIEVAVASGDAHTTVSAALETAINAEDDLHCTASDVLGTVTLTCRHKGTLGNGLDLDENLAQGEKTPAGLTTVITNIGSVVAGATDPDLADAITAMADVQYRTIVNALADATNVAKLEAELLTRWGPMVQKQGVAFQAVAGTQGAMASVGNARNSFLSSYMGAGVSPAPVWMWAAMVAGLDAGESDPARPRQTLALAPAKVDRIFAPAVADRLTRSERNTLLTDGIATHVVNEGGAVTIERLITTYQTNANGTVDDTFLDITTPRTLDYLRYSLRSRIKLKFPRHKLANDGTRFSPGQAIVTPAMIRSEILALFLEWEDDGLVEDFDQFAEELIVERNSSDANRIDVRLGPNLVNQFRVLAGQLQFLL